MNEWIIQIRYNNEIRQQWFYASDVLNMYKPNRLLIPQQQRQTIFCIDWMLD